MTASTKNILLKAFLVILSGIPALCGNCNSKKDSTHSAQVKKAQPINIGDYLQVFYPLDNNAEYSVTVCADLPDNSNPKCVYKKGEPGHVFLILSKRNLLSAAVITKSFGFYPRVLVSALVKQVKSKISDNSNREFDASIEKKLTNDEFAFVLQECEEFAKKKYNLKKYNCYDYVLEIFNSLPGIEKLPVTKVKFPFIFGKGGSPCGLYRDLKNLSSTGSSWAPYIKFGILKSPPRDTFQNLIANF
ncbi:MAG: hypothetical protein H0V30_14285 [Chitinophagaceae bacterium]|nr:hypothetical protein [Chitinophagaceae bacterium]